MKMLEQTDSALYQEGIIFIMNKGVWRNEMWRKEIYCRNI